VACSATAVYPGPPPTGDRRGPPGNCGEAGRRFAAGRTRRRHSGAIRLRQESSRLSTQVGRCAGAALIEHDSYGTSSRHSPAAYSVRTSAKQAAVPARSTAAVTRRRGHDAGPTRDERYPVMIARRYTPPTRTWTSWSHTRRPGGISWVGPRTATGNGKAERARSEAHGPDHRRGRRLDDEMASLPSPGRRTGAGGAAATRIAEEGLVGIRPEVLAPSQPRTSAPMGRRQHEARRKQAGSPWSAPSRIKDLAADLCGGVPGPQRRVDYRRLGTVSSAPTAAGPRLHVDTTELGRRRRLLRPRRLQDMLRSRRHARASRSRLGRGTYGFSAARNTGTREVRRMDQ